MVTILALIMRLSLFILEKKNPSSQTIPSLFASTIRETTSLMVSLMPTTLVSMNHGREPQRIMLPCFSLVIGIMNALISIVHTTQLD
jgi:hypothetical protein